MPLKFVQSQYGNPMLIHDGYVYTKKSENASGTITWRCKQYSKHCCRVVVHTSSNKKTGSIVGDVPNHHHSADISSVEAAKVKANLKKRARKCDDLPSVLVAKSVKNVSDSTAAKMPNEPALKMLFGI
ncbi:unnamed protein product [Phaedon cochleariae]|uniref:FLYWCH-type domain-containing protein n=1 Tax=Phaedon cochleariae TaxID=80249 RepID=A0A9P0DDH9_PHACE|nr:unnamed protein product [Phaedon cochleariae]